MNAPASPRQSGFMFQRASSGRLRNSCSTSTRPKTVSARPWKSAEAVRGLRTSSVAMQPRPARTSPGRRARRRRAQATSCAAWRQSRRRRWGPPFSNSRNAYQAPMRRTSTTLPNTNSQGACVTVEQQVDERPGCRQPYCHRQRPAALAAAPAQAEIDGQGGVGKAREPIAPGGHGREVRVHEADGTVSFRKGTLSPQMPGLWRPAPTGPRHRRPARDPTAGAWRPAVTAARSMRTCPGQHDADGFEQDDDVEK